MAAANHLYHPRQADVTRSKGYGSREASDEVMEGAGMRNGAQPSGEKRCG